MYYFSSIMFLNVQLLIHRKQQDDSQDNVINAATLWLNVTLHREVRLKRFLGHFYTIRHEICLIYVIYSHITLINKII